MFRDRPRRDQAIGRLVPASPEFTTLNLASGTWPLRPPPPSPGAPRDVIASTSATTRSSEAPNTRRQLTDQLGAGKRRECHQHPHLGRAKDLLDDQIGLKQRIDCEHHPATTAQIVKWVSERFAVHKRPDDPRLDAVGVKGVRSAGDLCQSFCGG